MPRGHLFAVCFQSHAARAEMPNGLALSLSQERRVASGACVTGPPVPLGAVRGLGQMGYRREQGEDGRVEGMALMVCSLPLPIRAFNMPSRDPLLRTAHTSLGCQDNGQQARAVTPHFLCTELSNHDRCRQCCLRRYQGPLHFLSVWPSQR